jgi:RNA polymerase sigma factor (sigma-70 family)
LQAVSWAMEDTCRQLLFVRFNSHHLLIAKRRSDLTALQAQSFLRTQVRGGRPGIAARQEIRHALSVPPSLNSLQQGDPAAWDEVFDWLWPTVLAAAKLKLEPFFPAEAEDVAIEALEEVVEKVRQVQEIEELKPLAASIAHHRAVSLLRERFAKKRGEGKIVALDRPPDASGESPVTEIAVVPATLDALDRDDLAALLTELQQGVTSESRAVIGDFFIHSLSYQEIAAKHTLTIGTVGVYLKRGLEALRKAAQRRPKLMKELEAFLR